MKNERPNENSVSLTQLHIGVSNEEEMTQQEYSLSCTGINWIDLPSNNKFVRTRNRKNRISNKNETAQLTNPLSVFSNFNSKIDINFFLLPSVRRSR